MFSYHNHSDFSDGKGTCGEMALSAYRNGIKEYGFSDHFGIWHDGSPADVSLRDIDLYFRTLEKIKNEYSGRMEIRFGAELENLPYSNKKACEILNSYPIDYIIGSTHFIGDWALDMSQKDWLDLGEEGIHKRILEYWEAEYSMCRYADIDIVGHFDLYEKWGKLNDYDYTEYFIECIKVCKERGLATELNTAKKDPENHFYPQEKFLKIIAEYDIPLIISADAHCPLHVTRHFDKAKELFAKYGIKRTARFEKRKIKIETAEF